LLGASRESVVDAIRHLSRSSWRELEKQMLDLRVAIDTPKLTGRAISSRGAAENIVTAVLRADAESTEASGLFKPFVETLAKLIPGREAILTRIARRYDDSGRG
jgi:hypothetical protein